MARTPRDWDPLAEREDRFKAEPVHGPVGTEGYIKRRKNFTLLLYSHPPPILPPAVGHPLARWFFRVEQNEHPRAGHAAHRYVFYWLGG
jgi:hypothetical protein